MAKIQPVWAIDIGQAALKALKLFPDETPDHVVAEAFDYVEYPKILSQPDADPEGLVREAMTTFIERNDLKGCRVAVAVPGQAGLVKFVKLPPVEKKRIPDIVKFEATQVIPFPLPEVIWDWQEINTETAEEEDDFSQTEVGLFAMKREQIQRAIQPFQAAGIEVDIVQMSPIALCNYIAFDRIDESIQEGGSIVVLDIGADNTDLIITDGKRIWQRNVPIGGNHFTRVLTKELKLTFAKAEHLKKNATKAPDPRAVFTAMRGVFNDFASEVNRSIGFYSSVNRKAKISKVVGLGNGFKLPGLQKFLQQNLNQDVERLEHFERLVGDEVTTAPQFQENLPSFAVAYGLGLQGLGQGGLNTNLLPRELLQTRLIRAKKPWALVASALLMLGFSALFLGDFRAWAKVDNPAFASAVQKADSVSQRGSQFQSDYDSDTSNFNAKKKEGQLLVEVNPGGANFPLLLQVVSRAIYDPREDNVRRLEDGRTPSQLNFEEPEDRELLETLRVHVDAIRPVWQNDLSTWFNNELKQWSRDTMHPYDVENPPTGSGWVIEVVGHHYNPISASREGGNGPYFFLTQRVLPRMWEPPFRRFGLSHAAVRWLATDAEWTSEKGLSQMGIPAGAPKLAHSKAAPKAAAGGAAGAGGMEQMMMMEMMGGMMGGYDVGGGMPGMEMMGGGMEQMMMEMMGGRTSAFGGYGAARKKEQQIDYKTRTDFVIHLVWQPPAEDEPREELAEIQAKLVEAQEKARGIARVPDLREIEEESLADSEQAVQEVAEQIREAAAVMQQLQQEGQAEPGAAPPANGPDTP